MHADMVWLAVLVFSLPALTQCQPLYVLTAPSLLRVGCEENMFVEAQEYTGKSFSVEITVMDFPHKTQSLLSKTVTLSETNNFHVLEKILIPDGFFHDKTHQDHYVYLQAKFPQQQLEKPIQVSFQSGYIFVQTEKTLYTPLDRVYYRVFVTNAELKPLSSSPVSVDLVSPDGRILHREILFPSHGIGSGRVTVPEISRAGTWKLVSRFINTLQNFTSDFEVKEYVQPNFEVRLTPAKHFFYIDDTELSVEVAARYLFGKDVSGKALVVFGVLTEDGQKKSIPASLQTVNIDSGKGKATLTREQILTTFPDIRHLIKLSLYVSASVLTESGSEMAERRGIQILTSPYTIHFKKTPTYFKQGMPFEGRVYVTDGDNTPAKNIYLEVTPGPVFVTTLGNGEARFVINVNKEASSLLITVRTKVQTLPNERQAVAQMTALPYRKQGSSQNDLKISIRNDDLHIGSMLQLSLNLGNSPSVQDQIKEITYLVMSKGRLIRAQRHKRLAGQSLIALNMAVTEDMVPSFRFVAYYHVGTEVVSDSVWVDVKDTCMGTLQVTSTKPKDVYEPRRPFSLTITGDPGARVGLVAVDKSVYVLNSKNRLTQSKIWDIVEKHDIGCTPGSGADNMGVFYDAGLVFQSSAGGTIARSDPSCPIHPARRRRRSLGEEDDSYVSTDEIVSRSHFPESWLWQQVTLPDCATGQQGCTFTSTVNNNFLKDSITTWEITAISLSKTHGICVADPFEITVKKHFFIDLKLPYAAVRNEQLEIKAVLYNYLEEKIKVRVELMETEQVCSAASKKRKYRLPEVDMDPLSSRAVPFVIIPMALGLHSIEVKAAVFDSFRTDSVVKGLHVVAEGLQTRREVKSVVLNPSDHGGVQREDIHAVLPKSQVPNTDGYTYISVTGERPVLEIISGSFMHSLIVQPRGNAEEVVMDITGSITAMHYLEKTHQLGKAGLEHIADASKFIQMGSNQLLAYRSNEGAFISTDRNPSSWLTAYIVKVFSLERHPHFNEDVLCSAVKWLVLRTQQPNGIFKEVGRVSHGDMMGDVQGKDSDTSMTAFVLVAMQEARHICAAKVNSLLDSIKKASEFLSGRIKSLTNPYAVALTAYALSSEGNHQLDILNRFSSGKTHWLVTDRHLVTLEATGYALMALVKAKELDQAGRVVKWLIEQKFYGGRDGSTQATIIVFQALAMYVTEMPEAENTNLRVRFTRSKMAPVTWVFSGNYAGITRTLKVQAGMAVTVTADGAGKGSLSATMVYNGFPEEQEPECRNFELEVKLEREPKVTKENALETYKVTIDMLNLSTRDATMSILDITMLTGFIADKEDLETLTTGKDRYVQKIETDKQLSEKGSLIFYLDKVSHPLVFRIHKMNKVGLLQPAAVTLYEYYSMDNRCMKFYHPEKKNGALNRICHEDVCRCAEENCSYQRKNVGEDLERVNTACSAGMDYVYKVKVLSTDLTYTIDRFTVLVEDVFKEGTDSSASGKNRTFVAHPQCREATGLKKGKTYLIMGKSVDLIRKGDSLTYMMGEGTWIEYWPTALECRQPALRGICVGIEEATADLITFGCPA